MVVVVVLVMVVEGKGNRDCKWFLRAVLEVVVDSGSTSGIPMAGADHIRPPSNNLQALEAKKKKKRA